MLPFGVFFTKEVDIALPAKPSWMSEPAFAHLVFEDACTVS